MIEGMNGSDSCFQPVVFKQLSLKSLKGQLISKLPFGVSHCFDQITIEICWKISALASKKKSNKDKSLIK